MLYCCGGGIRNLNLTPFIAMSVHNEDDLFPTRCFCGAAVYMWSTSSL